MLRENLPDCVVNALGELLNAEQLELDKIEKEIKTLFSEFFIKTATSKTLPYWEDFDGI